MGQTSKVHGMWAWNYEDRPGEAHITGWRYSQEKLHPTHPNITQN